MIGNGCDVVSCHSRITTWSEGEVTEAGEELRKEERSVTGEGRSRSTGTGQKKRMYRRVSINPASSVAPTELSACSTRKTRAVVSSGTWRIRTCGFGQWLVEKDWRKKIVGEKRRGASPLRSRDRRA
jgi:hypothetical protein